MKVIILTGPGEVSKRTQLLKIKQGFDSSGISELDFKQVGPAGLMMALQSSSLFVEQRLVVVNNLTEDFDLAELKITDPQLTLVIIGTNYSPTKTLLKSAIKSRAQVLTFEGEKETSAFPFLDALIEKKPQAAVELKKLEEEYGSMYVLTMIYYLLRRNLLPAPASDFLRRKINQQKQAYQLVDWQRLYRLTLETEDKIKTGLTDPATALPLLVEQFIAA